MAERKEKCTQDRNDRGEMQYYLSALITMTIGTATRKSR